MGKVKMPLVVGGGGSDGIEVITTMGDLGSFKRGLGTDGSASVAISLALPSAPSGTDWYQSFVGAQYISDDILLAMWNDRYSYYSSYGSSSYESRLYYGFYKDNGTSFTQLKTGMLWSSTEQALTVYTYGFSFAVEGSTLVVTGPNSQYSKKVLIISATINSDYTLNNIKTLQYTGTSSSDDSFTSEVYAIDESHFVFGDHSGTCFYSGNNGYPKTKLAYLTVGSSLTATTLGTAFEYCHTYGAAVGKYKGGLVFFGSCPNVYSSNVVVHVAYITASGAIYRASTTVSGAKYTPKYMGAFHLGNGKFLVPTGSLTFLFTLNEACTAWTITQCATGDFPGITDIGATTVNGVTEVLGARPLAHLKAIVDLEDAVIITNRQYLGILVEDAGAYGSLRLGESTALTGWKINNYPYQISYMSASYTIAPGTVCKRSDMKVTGCYVSSTSDSNGDTKTHTLNFAKIESLLKLSGYPNGTYRYKKSGDKVTWLI